MIRRVEITRRAEKQVRRLPLHVGEKLVAVGDDDAFERWDAQ